MDEQSSSLKLMDVFYAAVKELNVTPDVELATLIAMTKASVFQLYGQAEMERFSEVLLKFAATSPFQPQSHEV